MKHNLNKELYSKPILTQFGDVKTLTHSLAGTLGDCTIGSFNHPGDGVDNIANDGGGGDGADVCDDI